MRGKEYMDNLRVILCSLIILCSCSFEKPQQRNQASDVERILFTLSGNQMQGRANFTEGIDKAAGFIEKEFRNIGLVPLKGERNFRQLFSVMELKPDIENVYINGKKVSVDSLIVITDHPVLNYSHRSDVELITINSGEIFLERYHEIILQNKSVLVLVHHTFSGAFNQLRTKSRAGRLVNPDSQGSGAAIFVLGINNVRTFNIAIISKVKKRAMANVVGMIPGKSRPNEQVVFSAHYDHLGIIKPRSIFYNLVRLRILHLRDSIANGADDNASGVTAVISLAKHFKKANGNQRTLIFVAFAGEEIGHYGSDYFSRNLDPSAVVAMFNIEMIGKESKFGKKSAYITGYNKSDLGAILQRNLIGTNYKFYPDPYPEQDLFNRSDNASMASVGIPAHTISTDQIDYDKFYHTVGDEFETLDVSNINATIQAIAQSAKSIVAGTDTPKRIPVNPVALKTMSVNHDY